MVFLDYTYLKMSWIQHHFNQKDGYFAYPPPLSPSSQVSYTLQNESSNSIVSPPSSSSSSGSKISPAVLFVIVILAVLFFISGLLHLLVRFLVKQPSSSESPRSSRYPGMSSSDALQRQLQQLFHLHDSGLDQAFIDSLPVFEYKEVVGAKEPFDCVVCLCEFCENDKLRLLPLCSHAFHISCIDTWLLSNSSCPLCRSTLCTPWYQMENPVFDFDDLRENDGCPGNGENGNVPWQKSVEMEEIVVEKNALPVRLGKFRRLGIGEDHRAGGETSSSNLDARRCFSMGSYQYVLGESDLRVPLSHDQRGHGLKLADEIVKSRHSSVDAEAKKIINITKGESFSVSKIWLWSRKGKFSSDSPPSIPVSLNADLPWMQEHRRNDG